MAVRRGVTSGAVTALVGLGAFTVISAPPVVETPRSIDVMSSTLDQLMVHNRCSVTGFNRRLIPSHAIVRTPQGALEVVSFDHGWHVFSGDVAGQLVAVCLGPDQTPATDSDPLGPPAVAR